MDNSRNYVRILVDTLEKKKSLLKDILETTMEQSNIAEREPFDEVMLEKTLNKKEILIAKLNELDDGFETIYKRVRNEVQGKQDLYQKELVQMQQLIKDCTDFGVEIQVLEERNRIKLAGCFSKKRSEYVGAKNAARIASHYHKSMNNTKILDSYFLDKKK